MEVVTVNGGVKEVTPAEMARAIEQGGRRQVELPQAESGGDLLIDEETGRVIFQPNGHDPLGLKGLEIDIPRDAKNLGFAFGGQPVLYADESGREPEPCTIIGFSVPNGPSYNAIEDLQKNLRKLQSTEARATAPVRKHSFQQNGRQPVTRTATGPPKDVSRLLSPRGAPAPSRSSTGLKAREQHHHRGSGSVEHNAPRMLFRAGDFTTKTATITNQLYHQKLRPQDRVSPGDICCGAKFDVSRSAANVLRATADWLNQSAPSQPAGSRRRMGESQTEAKQRTAPRRSPSASPKERSSPRSPQRPHAGRTSAEASASPALTLGGNRLSTSSVLRDSSPGRAGQARQATRAVPTASRETRVSQRMSSDHSAHGSLAPRDFEHITRGGVVMSRTMDASPERGLQSRFAEFPPAAPQQLSQGERKSENERRSPTLYPRAPPAAPMRSELPQKQTSSGSLISRKLSARSLQQAPTEGSNYVYHPIMEINSREQDATSTHHQAAAVGGRLGSFMTPDSLIPGVPIRFERPISLHPQIPGVDENGRAQLVLDESDLHSLGLNVNMLDQLRASATDESPMIKANRAITAMKQERGETMTEKAMTAETEARRLQEHAIYSRQFMKAATEGSQLASSELRIDPSEAQVIPSESQALIDGLRSQAPSEESTAALAANGASEEAPPVRQYELTTESGVSRLVEKIELVASPRIEFLRAFASEEECEELNTALTALDQSPQIPNNLLAATALEPTLNKWISRLLYRIAQICGVQVESIVGLCPSSISKGAVDATKDFSTIVRLYLDDVPAEGVSSDFPELGITIKPRMGAALRWDCKDANGQCTPLAKHKEVLSPRSGTNGRRLLTAYLI